MSVAKGMIWWVELQIYPAPSGNLGVSQPTWRSTHQIVMQKRRPERRRFRYESRLRNSRGLHTVG